MLVRILIALIGIPILLALLFWPGGKPFAALCTLIALVGVMEINAALDEEGRSVSPLWPIMGAGLLLLSVIHPFVSTHFPILMAGYFLAFLAWETLSGEPMPFARISVSLLMMAYPGLMAIPVLLRLQGEGGRYTPWQAETGALWVLVALLLVWATDSGAYFVGKAFGRHKMAPHLSPNKTWEGAFGGWLFAVLFGAGLGAWLEGALFPGGLLSGAALGALAGVWAQIGDLAESAMKRELEVKDFGGWMPGHGGALDRFDSFLFVCPLVYLWSLLSY